MEGDRVSVEGRASEEAECAAEGSVNTADRAEGSCFDVQCNKPVFLQKYNVTVPCGRCLACRIARSREWAIRLIHEMSYHQHAAFVTLTYNDESIPKNNSVSKDELQRFFKRLRLELGNRRICYFACGEYGERLKRPHYHAIVLGLHPEEDRNLINEAWSLGFIETGTVTYDSCRYTADYVMKSYIGKKAKEFYGDRNPPFSIMSMGIGRRYALDNAERLKKNRYITIRGVKVGLPRYYAKVLGLNPEDYLNDVIRRNLEKKEELEKRAKNPNSAGARAVSERAQREATIKARISLRRKGLF